ncbi:MAG: hypothetical protein CVU57_09390 [Deltaproteobacteria bacterium HGW-Deltaproteobacteria-15]|jgi:hypothetical protein|nr:MAG: hypothetical protein CVU57_09390 [Deltaproteobacteria bacterium HGW-Deltaproteobacteria-15]
MDEQKKTVIQRWMVKADHDLITARVMLENDPSVTDTICFHAQQCVEKAHIPHFFPRSKVSPFPHMTL